MSDGGERQLENEITHWVLTVGQTIADPLEFVDKACEALRAGGTPLDRVVLVGFLLHPLIHGVSLRWNRGEHAEMQKHYHGLQHMPSYRLSPVSAVVDGHKQSVRARLDVEGELEFPLLDELRAEGFTDYICLSVRFRNGRRHAATAATREPGGFNDDHLSAINISAKLVALIFEIDLQRAVMQSICETYLGRDAGHRVLEGQVRRGDGETIEACLFLCDLRHFTALSDHHTVNEVLHLLDEYFDVVVSSIEEHGGEVLKFIGDEVLAIFRAEDQAEACRRGLRAARKDQLRSNAVNRRRKGYGRPLIHFGTALHYGTVMYGNIGSSDRLDFTVIGPAVNMASRLCTLCSQLSRRILVSAAFAALHGENLEDLGTQKVRGLEGGIAVYGLANPDER